MTVLVGLSLAINLLLATGYLQLRGDLDEVNRRMRRLEATKADADDPHQMEDPNARLHG